jgi:mRNA-degrading endonuclease RelE of RelBE toxin-antitoxin system
MASRRLCRIYGSILMPSETAASDNPMSSPAEIEVRFTPEFKRNLRALAKKYRHIRSDVQPIIEQLAAGNFLGTQVPRIGYTIFKVRVQNSGLRKGKRAGYRLIYYLQTQTQVILITIYSKTEQSDISAAQIRRIVQQFED